MSAGAMATAAGLAAIMCVLVIRKVSAKEQILEVDGDGGGRTEAGAVAASARRARREERWPDVAPVSWGGSVATAARTVQFALAETLGKWPFVDLVIGVRYLIRRENLRVASVFGTGNCVQLHGAEIVAEVVYLQRLLKVCFLFTKRKFPVFLETAGYSQEDVLFQKPKGGFMKPAFTIVCDRNSNCIFLVVRGASSFKDRLTAAASAVVPFHHLVLQDGHTGNVVLGYAHCGMLAAARWIANCATPHLIKAVSKYPEYNVKIIGHSMGGGTAALLSCILREYEELSTISCVAFGPAACMTWDLAESCKFFITTIVNNSDSVPSLSTASVDDFRAEVVASSWSKEFRDQVPFVRFMNNVCRTVSTLGCCLPFNCDSESSHASDDAPLNASNATQSLVVSEHASLQAVVSSTGSSLSCWPCMKPRRRLAGTEHFVFGPDGVTCGYSYLPEIDSRGSMAYNPRKHQTCFPPAITAVVLEEDGRGSVTRNEAAMDRKLVRLADIVERRQLFPPGRIMHMVGTPAAEVDGAVGDEQVGIFETQRDLYCKVRLSRTMINDHYMPMYMKTMEKLLSGLTKDILKQDDLDSSGRAATSLTCV